MKKESKITKENAYDGVIVEAVGPVVDVRFEQSTCRKFLRPSLFPSAKKNP